MSLSARLARLVVRRPLAVLAIASLLALSVVPLSIRLRLDTDLVGLLPRHTPAAQTFARFTRLFASEQLFVVLVEGDDGARLTEFADQYAEALRARPDIAEVRVRLGAGAAAMFRDHLLDLLDDTEQDALVAHSSTEQLATQARRLRALLSAPGGGAMAPLVTADPMELLPLVSARLQAGLPVDPSSGYYKSPDGKALLLLVQPRHAPFDDEADRRLIDGANEAAQKLGASVGIDGKGALSATPRVGFTGPYAYTLAYRDWLHRDMQLSTVVSAGSVLLFFAVLLGALRALPIVAVPLFVGLWFTSAVAVVAFGRVNAVSLAFGTILLSIGIDLPIQIYNRLREELRSRAPLDALERTISELAGPALVATLGPTVVFLACSLSEYKGLGELGVLAGAGLMLNLAVMVTVFPALLAVVPARLWMPRQAVATDGKQSGRVFAALGRAASSRPRLVLGIAAAALIALAPAARKLEFEKRLISIEPPSMAPAQVRRELEKRFGVRDRLLVVLHDGATVEEAQQQSDAWRVEAEALRSKGLLIGYESLSSVFPSKAEVARRRARLAEKLGGDMGRLARDLRAALVEAGFDPEPFAGFLAQLEHPAAPLGVETAGPELGFLVRAHLKTPDTTDDHRAYVTTFLYPTPGRGDEPLDAATEFARRHPTGGQLTGAPVLEDALYRVVRRDTIRVTTASVLAVIVLLVVFYRRARPVIAVLVPLALAWMLFAAVLGAFGLPLNLFNLLTVPLVVGYGIDDHVFLVHRFEEDPAAGPARALASTGRAIVVTSLSTMAGFAGLAVARFDGLRQLGIAGTLAVALCLLAAFAVLPALLAVLYRGNKGAPPSDV